MRFRNSHLRHRQRIVLRLFALLLLLNAGRVVAQTSAFTYQGRLTDGGTPANGNYDLQFTLWDSASGGSQIGSTPGLPPGAGGGRVVPRPPRFCADGIPGGDP